MTRILPVLYNSPPRRMGEDGGTPGNGGKSRQHQPRPRAGPEPRKELPIRSETTLSQL